MSFEELEENFDVRLVQGPLALKRPLLKISKILDEEELTESQRRQVDAQRSAQQEILAKQQSYQARVAQFNSKLAKESEHNEMPRISGQ